MNNGNGNGNGNAVLSGSIDLQLQSQSHVPMPLPLNTNHRNTPHINNCINSNDNTGRRLTGLNIDNNIYIGNGIRGMILPCNQTANIPIATQPLDGGNEIRSNNEIRANNENRINNENRLISIENSQILSNNSNRTTAGSHQQNGNMTINGVYSQSGDGIYSHRGSSSAQMLLLLNS